MVGKGLTNKPTFRTITKAVGGDMLRETQIAGTKTPSKLTKLSDGGGLQLWLMPSGTRLWRLSYRFDGAQRALKLGSWPELRLADARKERDIARGVLAAGQDPGHRPRRTQQVTASGVSFKSIVEEWREKQVVEKRAERTIEKNDRLLAHALPYLGDQLIDEIETSEVFALLRQVSAKGFHETAARLRMLLSVIFRYAVATGRAKNDPAASLKGHLARPAPTPRSAIVDPAKFGRLLGMIDGFDGLPPTKAALRLLPLFACRPGELRLAQWQEFDFAKSIWTIPAARMKMRREHKMHLPDDVIAILRDLKRTVGSDGYLFPALGRAGRTMSENTVNAALRSMGVPGSDHCAHGFRSSFSTIANESGKWRPDVIERHLAHEDANSVRRTYNRAELWKERVELAEWWVNECRSMAVLWG